jgi:hypothetical protein
MDSAVHSEDQMNYVFKTSKYITNFNSVYIFTLSRNISMPFVLDCNISGWGALKLFSFMASVLSDQCICGRSYLWFPLSVVKFIWLAWPLFVISHSVLSMGGSKKNLLWIWNWRHCMCYIILHITVHLHIVYVL